MKKKHSQITLMSVGLQPIQLRAMRPCTSQKHAHEGIPPTTHDQLSHMHLSACLKKTPSAASPSEASL